jgi:hypothetical protein
MRFRANDPYRCVFTPSNKSSVMLKQYPSISALLTDYETFGQDTKQKMFNALSWFGRETRNETINKTRFGDTTLVNEAENLLTQIDTNIETPRRTWNRSPVGAYYCVPEVLAGLPTPGRTLQYEMDERAPINILVNTTCSAGVSASTMRKRGTVILALTMALARVRPIHLNTVSIMDGQKDGTGETIFVAPINTTPLDLATACYVLSSVGYTRRVTYGLGRGLNSFGGRWPRTYRYGSPKLYFDNLTLRLNLNPIDTLVIYAAELDDPLLTDPVNWVDTQVKRFTAIQEEI